MASRPGAGRWQRHTESRFCWMPLDMSQLYSAIEVTERHHSLLTSDEDTPVEDPHRLKLTHDDGGEDTDPEAEKLC